MVTLGAVIVGAALAAVLAGSLVPRLRAAAVAGATLLVGIVASIVWWALLFFQIVRIDPMMQRLNIPRLGTVGTLVVFLGPAALTAALFAVFASRPRRGAGRPQ